jgi:hypothetical protein
MRLTGIARNEHTSLTAFTAYQSTISHASTQVRLASHAPLQRLVALCALEPHKIVGDALVDGLADRLGYLNHIFMMLEHRSSKRVGIFFSPIRAITWTDTINILVESWQTVATQMKQTVCRFFLVISDPCVDKVEFTQLIC